MPRIPPKMPRSSVVQLFESFPAPPESPLSELGEKIEWEMKDAGITPETDDWDERSRNWFYGHGGSLDPETGKCIYTKEHNAKPLADLVKAITDVQQGKF